MKFPLFLSISLSLGVSPAASAASDSAAPGGAPVELEAVVVTAAQSREPLVVVADPRAPAQPIPANDGADALKSVPGFTVIRKGGTSGDPVLRGMAGSRLGVQLDGQTVLGGCGNRMDPPTAYVFPAAYDRLVVIKGPQSVVHGPGHSAGLVLFERTHRRLSRSGANFRGALTLADAGRVDTLGELVAGSPAWQVRVTGSHSRADDYRDGSGNTVHAEYERWSANAAVAWTPDDFTSLEISGARSDGEAAYADRAMDGVRFDRDNTAFRFRREAVSTRVAAVELRAFRNYVDHVMDNFSLRPFVPAGMMTAPAVSNPDRRTHGATAQLELTPGFATRLTLGVDRQSNTHTLRSSSNQPAQPYELRPRIRDARFVQRGVFAESATTLAAGRRIFAGARLDRWEVTDSRAVIAPTPMLSVPNPGAGRTRASELAGGFARYEQDFASAGLTAFAGLGRVQRFPDYWELFKNESAGSVSALGTRPETTTQIDAGLLGRHGAVEWHVSVFAARLDDYILVQTGYAKPAGMGTRLSTITRNIRARTRGGEAGATWRLTSAWKLDASLAAVRGENETDARPLAQLPPFESRLALAYTRPAWSTGALWRAVARQNRVAIGQGNIVGQDLGPTAGFSTLALHASRKLGEHARISAGLDNVFDRTFAEHLSRAGALISGFEQTTRVNEPGRTAWVRLDLSF